MASISQMAVTPKTVVLITGAAGWLGGLVRLQL